MYNTLRLLGIDREHKSSFKFVLEMHSYVKNCKSYLLQGESKINQVVSSLQTATPPTHRERECTQCIAPIATSRRVLHVLLLLLPCFVLINLSDWLSVRPSELPALVQNDRHISLAFSIYLFPVSQMHIAFNNNTKSRKKKKNDKGNNEGETFSTLSMWLKLTQLVSVQGISILNRTQ